MNAALITFAEGGEVLLGRGSSSVVMGYRRRKQDDWYFLLTPTARNSYGIFLFCCNPENRVPAFCFYIYWYSTTWISGVSIGCHVL